ncbi:STAS/SEC14 domain-containing protein [Agromyces sp. MMS24-K17]|uniref:STAS/SEC14 domain-containing protein n=1 Tax=Agromyces sp. MMS24-K17 TaxID=3372850 RepID=UPI003755111F
MIEPLSDLPDGVIGFRAVGTIEASDYRERLRPAIDEAVAAGRKLDLVFVLGPEFDHYSLSAMWEDAKLLGEPWSSWGRAAFVTDHDVLAGIANAFGGLVPGEFEVFPLEREAEAIQWVAADPAREPAAE